MKPRINLFEQIGSFYSFVFENQDKVRQSHCSLYAFLLNQNNRNNWSEWFKCPFDLAMAGACIGSKSTYYKCLEDLEKWKLIKWKKGENSFKAPQISIIVLSKSEPLTVPQSEPLSEPLTVPQSEQLSVLLTGKIERLITNNYKLITNNIKKWIKYELENSSSNIFDFKSSLISIGVSEKVASDWMEVRKKKKSSNTETAFNTILSEIKKTGISPNECITEAVSRSWQGFKAEWVNNIQKTETIPTTTFNRNSLNL